MSFLSRLTPFQPAVKLPLLGAALLTCASLGSCAQLPVAPEAAPTLTSLKGLAQTTATEVRLGNNRAAINNGSFDLPLSAPALSPLVDSFTPWCTGKLTSSAGGQGAATWTLQTDLAGEELSLGESNKAGLEYSTLRSGLVYSSAATVLSGELDCPELSGSDGSIDLVLRLEPGWNSVALMATLRRGPDLKWHSSGAIQRADLISGSWTKQSFNPDNQK